MRKALAVFSPVRGVFLLGIAREVLADERYVEGRGGKRPYRRLRGKDLALAVLPPALLCLFSLLASDLSLWWLAGFLSSLLFPFPLVFLLFLGVLLLLGPGVFFPFLLGTLGGLSFDVLLRLLREGYITSDGVVFFFLDRKGQNLKESRR